MQMKWTVTWQNQQNDLSLCCPHEESFGPKLPIKRTAKMLMRLQTGRMPRLIWVFAGRTVILLVLGERGGSVVECWTPEREVGGSRPTAAVLCPWARHFTPRKYWLITQEAVAPSWYVWKLLTGTLSLNSNKISPKVLVNYPGSDGSVPTWLKNCWLGR